MTTRSSTAEHFGQSLGRGWRSYRRTELRLTDWFVSKGIPAAMATALLWAVKLGVLGLLLYVAFWFALLAFFMIAVARIASDKQPEEGFELQYPSTLEELRELPGYDPNLYEDSSHEMYREE
ncbi:hypothetical protein CF98_07310 [Halopseudomonas bauzanensis]|nr:hypothetical protein CF98_07310 [Halopseudomonas bauzanensis]